VPVNLQRFSELAGGNEEGMRDLAAIYIRQTAQQLTQLQLAVETGDSKQTRAVAHSCAGASATCGMASIAEPLCVLEKMGLEERLDTAPEELALVLKEFHRIQAFLAEAGLHQES
jgi:HPt (histidine-containing phosphotransfer) domain-containing protein